MKIAIRDQSYEVEKVGYKELSQLAKYVNALSLDQNSCLTPELDRAAAHALRKLIPTIDPLVANNELGIDLEFLTEFYPLYKKLEKIYQDNQNTVEVTVAETTKMKKARLEQELKELEGQDDD